METETLLAISAGVTFLLAIAAFWTIWQNYQLHKKERRERLLNEIIEWAEDVASIFEPADIPDLSDYKNAAKPWPFLSNQRGKLNSLQLLVAKGLAMCIIAEKINLKSVVENVSGKLENLQGCLWEFKRWEDTRPKNERVNTEFLRQTAEKLSQNISQLYASSVEVIRDVADLKSEGV